MGERNGLSRDISNVEKGALNLSFPLSDQFLFSYNAVGVNPNSATDSPVWVPDSEAKVCMHCLKSEFTVVNRRVSSGIQRWRELTVRWGGNGDW